MRAKLSLIIAAVLLIPAAGRAQESGGGRHEYFEQLREACDYGDENACWRLQQLRRQHRAREWGGQGGGQGYVVPPANNKAAVCTALRMNFNNCVAQQQSQPWRNINCNAWPVQLSASGCL
jgi:hypothetical protein